MLSGRIASAQQEFGVRSARVQKIQFTLLRLLVSRVFGFLRLFRRWKLKDRGPLPLDQQRDRHNRAVREFERVVVRMRHMDIDLTETGDRSRRSLFAVCCWILVSRRGIKGDFGARTQTDGDVGIAGRRKTTRDGIAEACRHEPIGNCGWSGSYMFKAVVAHEIAPINPQQFILTRFRARAFLRFSKFVPEIKAMLA